MARKAGRWTRWTRSTMAAIAIGTRREARSMGRSLVGCYSAVMRLLVAPLLIPLLLILGLAAPATAQSGLVRIEGKNFIAPDGSTLHLKGISLGNWLMPEGYMFKFEVAKAPRQIFAAFDRLLGPERAAAFWKQYRDSYITRDDIEFIKSAGFNMVRIPLHYRLFMTNDGTMTGDGWTLLDRVIGRVKDAGLYAIVDIHAAPGGQTGINHD